MTTRGKLKPRLGAFYAVQLPEADDFAFWRERARGLVQCDVPPDRIAWIEPGATGSLFASGDTRLSPPPSDARAVRASKAFVQAAQTAMCHSDPDRFGLLYRLLWRLQGNPRALEDRADADVRRLDEFIRQVRRDMHKMRAFVRFRLVPTDADALGPEAAEHYVAWFEPEHHILRANAGFFVRRFANMRWSILTPQGSLHWDGDALCEGPPAQKADAPAGDAMEELWRRYYASIFNPARLKIGAMLKEMPRKYWKNMPETALIADLVAGAQGREATMIDAGAIAPEDRPDSLSAIDKAIHMCRRCPIGELETRAVMGEGPQDADLMIVGEQPGDQEDLAGRPFVGPAGHLLDEHLEQAGIDRAATYVTNGVKHFKFVMRGKRRLHQSPTAKEIDTCRWWIEDERALVKPKLVLALGASAARSMLGRTVSISRERGRAHGLGDGSELWITAHPSYLLRLDGAGREEQERLFDADLAAVAGRLAELAGR
ncbi:UdgX family uracil-DNA binding protein [Altererythrobacter sp. KTW20L]|uniref:UdgX family uracil-DNA binding protein n=1 Tax=Altererythrobacter sp. KTW20L TaxID=2942210 RepID=UPI00201C94E3|nr:UdgX family uracil-DNA binding protein [Altererythrobacter sp. KTW20L]MCL6251186.1 UdgX family uracil-DNA binding protein [Altererythrobacter sp. KTW20L]